MPQKQKGIINTIKNLYSSADFYAGAPGVNIQGEGSAKSPLGASITLLVLIGTFWMAAGTISNVIFISSPSITQDSEQGTENITGLAFSNFFLAYSFFTPLSSDKNFGNSTNDYNITSTMSTLLGDCIHGCSNATFLMGRCEESLFDEITTLKGLPLNNSKNVTDIFKQYSYCLPPQFKASLMDNDSELTNFISSFTIFIPDTYNQTQSTTNTRMLSILFLILIIDEYQKRYLSTNGIGSPSQSSGTTTTMSNTMGTINTMTSPKTNLNTITNGVNTMSSNTMSSSNNIGSSNTMSMGTTNMGINSMQTTNSMTDNKGNLSSGNNNQANNQNGNLANLCPPCQSYEYCQNGKCVTQNTAAAIVQTVKTFNSYDDTSSANCKYY